MGLNEEWQGSPQTDSAKSQAKLKCVAKNFKQAETESEKTVPSSKFLRARTLVREFR